MNEELEQLAELALCNAFWTDFSALCNKYLKAAEGLDVQEVEMLMGEKTSIYGRDDEASGDVFFNIWTRSSGIHHNSTDHESLVEALNHPRADEVYLQGVKVFQRIDGEWNWADDPV